MRLHPALDVWCPCSIDDVLVAVDDDSPTAVEERDDAIRVFFASPDARDAGCAALRAAGYHTTALEVDDEDWARRSQQGLTPITVGRITIAPSAPPLDSALLPNPYSLSPSTITIVIPASMGFGTGHHATTRLCLEAMQQLPVDGAFVVDIGTGSGVLAIAASRLGAVRAIGIDVDPDAIQSARENLALNPDARHVSFEVDDIVRTTNPDIMSGRADIVTANLTGALIARIAPVLVGAVRAGGSLVLSGVLGGERNAVVQAFGSGIDVVRESNDGEWVGFIMKKR